MRRILGAVKIRVASSLCSVCIALLLAEFSVRLFFPQSLWRFRNVAQDWQLDAAAGWANRPNLDVSTRVEQGWIVRFQTNLDGLTSGTAQRAKTSGTVRVMIFGDSTTIGRWVPQDRTVTACLERLLRAQGANVEVINAGVEMYSTDQVLVRIRTLVPLYHPDVVAYQVCNNDFGANDLRQFSSMSKPRFEVGKDGALQELPPDLQNSRLETSGLGPRRWIQHSALYRFLYPHLVGLMARRLKWEERAAFGYDAPALYCDAEAMNRLDWPLFAALLKKMDAVCRENGAKFFFSAHPAIEEVWDPFIEKWVRQHGLKLDQYDRHALEKRLTKVSEETSIPFCPVIDYFLKNQSRGPFYLAPRDYHCNPVGYQTLSERLAQCLVESGLININR